MFSNIKKNLKLYFPFPIIHLLAFKKLILNKESFLYKTGWMESIKQSTSCSQNGKAIPWMNHSIIIFLEERLNKNMTLFEFGSGYSTIFYSKLVNKVVSLEHNKNWLKYLTNIIDDNVTLIFQKDDIDGEYCRASHYNDNKYNLIIIDGRDRVNCIKKAVESLTNDGVILLDDSHREKYKEGVDYLIDLGYSKIDFEGLKQIGSNLSRTTVFYKSNNSLKI